jgi:ABC-2 type transport system permease protein
MNWEVRTMQSKTSYFNGTLFRKNLSRFWPLWGLASFLGALVPLALLLQTLRRGAEGYTPESAVGFTSFYYGAVGYALPVITLLYAILCAMAVWSYLYNSRSVGLMHSLPIRREGLFLTNFLSGMAMMLIPYVVTGGLCVLYSLLYGCFDLTGLAVTVAAVLGESLFYFGSATLVAFLVGNVFALPALYFLLHFLAVLLDWLVSAFSQGFLFGVSSGYSGTVEWLSPTVYLLHRVQPVCAYEEVSRRGASTGEIWYEHVLTEVHLEGLWIVGVYALAGVVLLALAWLLYRRRRSESAGDVVAVGPVKPLFRFGLAALAALLGGIALYELFWQNLTGGRYFEALPMLVCMAAAGAIGYYGASMLLAKSLRVFRGSWKGLALVLCACAALCGALRFDLLGVAERVPEQEEVETVYLAVAGNSYGFRPDREDALLEQVRTLHSAIAAERDSIIERQENWRRGQADGETTAYLRLTYHLKNGRTVQRRYDLPLSKAQMAQAGTYENLLDALVNGEAMKAKRLHLNDPEYEAAGGYLYRNADNRDFDLSSREAAAILEALGQDVQEGTWGTHDWFDEDNRNDYAADLNLYFDQTRDPEAGPQDTASESISIRLRPAMRHTTDCLRELGLMTEDTLRTYGELYPEDFDEAADAIAQEDTVAVTAVYS